MSEEDQLEQLFSDFRAADNLRIVALAVLIKKFRRMASGRADDLPTAQEINAYVEAKQRVKALEVEMALLAYAACEARVPKPLDM